MIYVFAIGQCRRNISLKFGPWTFDGQRLVGHIEDPELKRHFADARRRLGVVRHKAHRFPSGRCRREEAVVLEPAMIRSWWQLSVRLIGKAVAGHQNCRRPECGIGQISRPFRHFLRVIKGNELAFGAGGVGFRPPRIRMAPFGRDRGAIGARWGRAANAEEPPSKW